MEDQIETHPIEGSGQTNLDSSIELVTQQTTGIPICVDPLQKLAQIREELNQRLTLEDISEIVPATISPEQVQEIKSYVLDHSLTVQNLNLPAGVGSYECINGLSQLNNSSVIGSTRNKLYVSWRHRSKISLILCFIPLLAYIGSLTCKCVLYPV